MANKKHRRITEGLYFLYPSLIIKNKHLSKKDVYQIKGNISLNFSLVRIIVAILLYAVSFGMTLFMQQQSGGHQIEMYGYFSVVAFITSMVGCLSTAIVIVISLILKKKGHLSLAIIVNRIGSFVLITTLVLQMLFSIYADAAAGFTTVKEAVSASLVMVAIIIVIQPSYWIDAAFSIITTTLGLFGVSLYCYKTLGMQAFYYYAITAFIYPFICFFIVNTLFYAEAQHYIEILENEKLNDQAHYDKLTQCKNRHALVTYLTENAKKWESEESNVLVVLFDIDNFKQYNDQFSHLDGDHCLKAIADAIREAFPSPDLQFFRYGGEEFLLFFELYDENDAPTIMEQIRKSIRELKLEAPEGAPKNFVTISLGGLLIKDFKGFSFEEEMRIVDKYLYIAKASGKDVSCYNGDLL